MTTLAIEMRRTKAWWKELWVQVLIAMAFGIVLGVVHPDLASKMQPFGDAFIKAIRMLIAPIIFCTVVHGIAHMADMARVGRVALKAIIYFEIVTTIALVIALIMVNLLKPGAGMNIDPATISASVVEPYVTIIGGGRVSGRAVVDLDAVRRQKNPTSLLDPMNYLMGRLPVTATGVLRTTNGVGRFELESAAVSRVPVPKLFLQEIVSYYSRTPQNPAGINIDDPFQLPARIREIQVARGQAIIVQ